MSCTALREGPCSGLFNDKAPNDRRQTNWWINKNPFPHPFLRSTPPRHLRAPHWVQTTPSTSSRTTSSNASALNIPSIPSIRTAAAVATCPPRPLRGSRPATPTSNTMTVHPMIHTMRAGNYDWPLFPNIDRAVVNQLILDSYTSSRSFHFEILFPPSTQ